jgi:hypothetical protein
MPVGPCNRNWTIDIRHLLPRSLESKGPTHPVRALPFKERIPQGTNSRLRVNACAEYECGLFVLCIDVTHLTCVSRCRRRLYPCDLGCEAGCSRL